MSRERFSHIIKYLTTLVIIVGIFGEINAQKETPIYSFFTAGHAYGSPQTPQYGLHPPFVDYIPIINNDPNIKLGFLTGDVVVQSTPDYWDAAQLDINSMNMPIHIAAGNHDMSQEFLNRFENYYYSFLHQNDLFIILTPGLDYWNISGEQFAFLTNTLESNYASVNNIFIFLHELVWWRPDNEYQNVILNYVFYYPGPTNFDDVIKPLLLSYPNNFTIFAGDLGCSTEVTPYMYHSFDNITLIGSGMGSGNCDNFIITEVFEDSVYYNLVAINGNDPKALGELTDFSLMKLPEDPKQGIVSIYPNPFNSYFTVDYTSAANTTVGFELLDAYGKELLTLRLTSQKEINKQTFNRPEILGLRSGFYILKTTIEGQIYSFPIIKY